jgi:uncharacterized protein (UPF0179 family)
MNHETRAKAAPASQGTTGKKMITVIPTVIAKEGYSFSFRRDPGPECTGCKVRSPCLDNLDVGHLYVIKEVRSAEHYCALTGLKAKVAEVQKIQTRISLEKQRIMVGATTTYSKVRCNWKFCPNYTSCVANGLEDGLKIKVKEKQEEVSCPRGFKLVYAVVNH